MKNKSLLMIIAILIIAISAHAQVTGSNAPKGNIVDLSEKFDNASSINGFTKAAYQYDMYYDNSNLVLGIPEKTMGFAYVKDKEFDMKGREFRTSVKIKGHGGFYLAQFIVLLNTSTGQFKVSEFLQDKNSWNTITSGNLKDFKAEVSPGKNYGDDAIYETVYPCKDCNGWYEIILWKRNGKTELSFRGDHQNALVYIGDLPYLDKPYVFGLCANPGITRFDDYNFSDESYKLEYDNIVICPNGKMAVVDGKDVFLTECKFDVINDFVGNYALTGKGSETSEYAIIDKTGKLINGEFSFSVTDQDYNGVKETFNCKIIFKNGKLNGKFISNFSNSKKHSEVNFSNGNFVKHSLSIYNKDGSLLMSDAKEDYGKLSEYDKATLRAISEAYYELFLDSFDEVQKNKINMPGRQPKKESGKCPSY